MFELPRYKGIEEAMQDVRVWARDNGTEKVLGLMPDGRRVFEATGNSQRVALPESAKGNDGMFLVHSHPAIPAELSPPDMFSIVAMGAAGNIAVCSSDDTVSWTTGPVRSGLPDFLFFDMAYAHVQAVQTWYVNQIDPSWRVYVESHGNADKLWGGDKPDERWVVLSHFTNQALLESGFLRDYHVQQGEVALKAMARWSHIEPFAFDD